MIENCRSCGAAAPGDGSETSFTCTYCGARNVDEEFFIKRAQNANLAKSGSAFELGLMAFQSGDALQAEKHFESSIQEDENNLDAWIFLALSKAGTLKPSNYEKQFSSAKNCIAKAFKIDPNSETAGYASNWVANFFLSGSYKSSKYYFDTAEKKFIAFGVASTAIEESKKGFTVIHDAFSLDPTDSSLIIKISTLALINCQVAQSKYGLSSSDADKEIQFFLGKLLALYPSQEQAVQDAIKAIPSNDRILKAWEKNKKELNLTQEKATTPQAQSNLSPQDVTISKNYIPQSPSQIVVETSNSNGIYFLLGALVLAALVGGLIYYSTHKSGSSNEPGPFKLKVGQAYSCAESTGNGSISITTSTKVPNEIYTKVIHDRKPFDIAWTFLDNTGPRGEFSYGYALKGSADSSGLDIIPDQNLVVVILASVDGTIEKHNYINCSLR